MFSIIVPVYNAEQYLYECIESVLEQSCQAYELILIDDGSTDRSGAILDQFQKNYPNRIQVIHKGNGGQFSARKKGIDLAIGDYVITLDADDCLRKDALEIMNQYIAEADAPDIVFFKIGLDKAYSNMMVQYEYMDGEVFFNHTKKKLYQLLLDTSNLNSFCGKAYKRTLLQAEKWNEEVIRSMRIGEDLMQVLPLFTHAERVVYCDQILYYYRQVETSVTHTYQPSSYQSQIVIYQELEKYISIWELDVEKSMHILKNRWLIKMCSVVVQCFWSDKKTCREKLREIQHDPWFRELYKTADRRLLSIKSRIALYLTYRGIIRYLYPVLGR